MQIIHNPRAVCGVPSRMMVAADAARLRLTLATVAADIGGALGTANWGRHSMCPA